MLTLIAAAAVLGILILVHELGHFAMAKLTGIGVERFSLGFGPKVVSRQVGETEYQISAFPLGGYVKMVGENPEDEEKLVDRAKSFLAKPVRVRLLVVSAGPICNLLLAVVIFTLVFVAGVPVLQPVVGDLQEDFPARQAGIQKGDRIVSIDGRAVNDWEDMTDIIHNSPGKPLSLVARRQDRNLTFTVTPRQTAVKNIFGEDTFVGLIGIGPSGETITRHYDPFRAAWMALKRTWDIVELTFVGVVKIFQRVVPADTVGGPIMIVQMAGEQARMGVMNLIFLVAFLSINLGVFNLLPIPILDGGHIFFFLIEAVRGRPMSMRKREIVQQIGLIILLSIFLFASYNDIMRLASKFLSR